MGSRDQQSQSSQGYEKVQPWCRVKSEALKLKPGVHRWVWFRKQWKTDYEQTQAWECLGWLLQLSIGVSIVHLNRSRRERWLSSLGRYAQERSLLDVYWKHLIVHLKVLFFLDFIFVTTEFGEILQPPLCNYPSPTNFSFQFSLIWLPHNLYVPIPFVFTIFSQISTS